MEEKTNINTFRLSDLNQQNINASVQTINILTFLGLDYRDAPLIALYIVLPGINFKKSEQADNFIISNILFKKLKINMLKMDVRTF